MSQEQDLRAKVHRLSVEEPREALQARLDMAGLNTDLSSVPDRRVPETFESAISPLLNRAIGELSINEIRAITALVKASNSALDARPEEQSGQVREAITILRNAKSEGAFESLVLSSGDLGFLSDLPRRQLVAQVLECGMDYEKAFGLIREVTDTVGAMVLREMLESYVDKLRELLLAKPKEEGRGHFGSLEANRAFADALTISMDSLNVRILGSKGPATLMITEIPDRREAGYFKLSTGGTFSEIPAMKFVPTPIRGRPGRRRRSENAGR